MTWGWIYGLDCTGDQGMHTIREMKDSFFSTRYPALENCDSRVRKRRGGREYGERE